MNLGPPLLLPFCQAWDVLDHGTISFNLCNHPMMVSTDVIVPISQVYKLSSNSMHMGLKSNSGKLATKSWSESAHSTLPLSHLGPFPGVNEPGCGGRACLSGLAFLGQNSVSGSSLSQCHFQVTLKGEEPQATLRRTPGVNMERLGKPVGVPRAWLRP